MQCEWLVLNGAAQLHNVMHLDLQSIPKPTNSNCHHGLGNLPDFADQGILAILFLNQLFRKQQLAHASALQASLVLKMYIDLQHIDRYYNLGHMHNMKCSSNKSGQNATHIR